MTQPTSVNMTFDTSLVDLNPNVSFSTTESDPSDLGPSISKTPAAQPPSLFEDPSQETPKQSQSQFHNIPAQPPKPSTPVQHVATQEAYDQWAAIYDSDGNMLQAVDDIELRTLLPEFLNQVLSEVSTPTISLLDLGCGTGRNTEKLLSFALPLGRQSTVLGLDFSKGMLDLANAKLQVYNKGYEEPRVRLEQCDCFPTMTTSTAPPFPSVPGLTPVHGVISTLVLEHVPLPAYFATLASLLLPNGIAVITNMHSDMGAKSQAGFVNKEGVKVRGSSSAHTVQATVDEAARSGFEVMSVKEREVTKADMGSGAIGERGWKWVGTKVWYGLVVRKVSW
ncbi:S-adenosyl-L-methionine-dependent methyltransferase [Phaeosphaeria sp. MPI-PUGE-AT-0046c]|nr:S-adenosyl-L-methionine-dependent methyltransferase [Phaeosphaeria sp. MPI-PUGE-AT-0046c]